MDGVGDVKPSPSLYVSHLFDARSEFREVFIILLNEESRVQ